FAGGYVPLHAALSPNAILITWLTGQPSQPAGFLLAGYDGRTIRSAVIPGSNTETWSSPIIASWDGSAFALVFGRQPSSLLAIRVTEGGSLLDSTPFVLTANGVSNSIGVSPPVFASADTLQVAVWPDTQFSLYGDIVGRTFTNVAELAATPDRANLISWSGPAQTGAHVARAGAHEIAVWGELTGHLAVALDGVTFPIAPPTSFVGVGAGNGSFLVVWHDIDANFNWKVLAVRIAFDGRILDPTPIVLESRKVPPVTLSDIGVAFDGSTFLVTWSAVDVFTARLSEAGAILSSSTFPIANIATTWTFTSAHSPQVAWTGNGFFLAYSIEHVNYFDGKILPLSGIAGLHLDASREPVPPATTLFDGLYKDITPLAMAVGAGRSTLVWPSGDEITAAQATLDGVPVSASFGKVVQRSQACTRAPAIAWDGAEYVVAWTEGAVCNQSTVRAIRLDRFANPIDAEPFDVAADALSYTPSIVPTADGVVIAYSRNDAANGDAPRAFERSLARIASAPPRRRVVSH
ncbi:MAG TPA: hypothetical protein VNN08_13860, partial [Thermoanaerobaculia bacterium]|nr:hypothetical protein [Thermoanaerobaculia bacterium]